MSKEELTKIVNDLFNKYENNPVIFPNQTGRNYKLLNVK